jgi:thiol-disulfide isomerase/thioredoxin
MGDRPTDPAGPPRENRIVAAVLVAALLLTVAAVSYFRPTPASSAPPEENLLAAPVPIAPFTVTTLDGAEISSKVWAGKAVVVNFWATWCAPCVREMPALAALQDRMASDVVVVGLLQDTVTTAQARTFAAALRIRYPIARSTSEIERVFPPVERLPMTYLLDRSSRMVAMYLGELDLPALERDIRQVLAR